MENSAYLAGYLDGKSSLNIMEDTNGYYLTVHLMIPKDIKIDNLELIFTKDDITKSRSKGKNTVYDMRNMKCQKYIDFMKKHSLYFTKHLQISEKMIELYNKQNKREQREVLYKQFHDIDTNIVINPDRITNEYIAGFFDAHGSISERKAKNTIELKISMKNASGMLELFHKTMDIGILNYDKDMWRFGKVEFKKFYDLLSKYFIVRKTQLNEIYDKYCKQSE